MEKGLSKNFSVEPSNINCSFETLAGVTVNDLINNKNFVLLTNIANSIAHEFQIDDILRAGLRFFCFDTLEKDFVEVKKAFCSLYENDIVNSVENHLGSVKDCGINFDGRSDDNLNYHIRTGPYQSVEAPKYMDTIKDVFSEKANYNMICDIDIYENNFSLSGRTISKYFKPLMVKADTFTKSLLDLVKSKMES